MKTHLLWYITRASGIMALLLLTATMVLGLLTSARTATARWPRFAWQEIHRRLALLSVVFLGIHITSTVVDGYVPIGWLSVVVPFSSSYRTFWLGLGTAAFDALLAVGISSMLRSRISQGSWRALHWLAYLCWPLAVFHGLGMGTDRRTAWVLVVDALCVSAVAASGAWRLGHRPTAIVAPQGTRSVVAR